MILLNHSERQKICIKRGREQCPLYILLPQVALCRRNSMAYLTPVTAGIIRHEDANQIIIPLSFWNVIWKKKCVKRETIYFVEIGGGGLKSIDYIDGLILFYILQIYAVYIYKSLYLTGIGSIY